MRAFYTFIGSVSILALACGGMVDGGNDGGGGGDSGNGGSDGGGGTDGGSGGLCPTTIPQPQSSCPRLGLLCEIGSNRNYSCNTLVTCSANGWQVPLDNNCSGMPSTGCPPSSAQVPIGGACGSPAACEYPDVLCECNDMGMPGPTQTNRWQCEAPTQGCPRPRPHLGTPCAQDALICDYGACTLSSGIAEECQGGVWAETSWACPL